MPHPAELTPRQLLAECDRSTTRRGGPGGQHRNKVESAVVLVHGPTGLRAEASERRSQHQNHGVALFRLRINLALEVRTDRGDAGPSELWRSRCRNGRVAVNPEHDDFPVLLAEAMDVVRSCDDDLKAAAEKLGCSASQLVKLLQLERRAMERVNACRVRRGLRPLK